MKTSFKVAVAGALALAGGNALALSPAELLTAAGNGTLVTLYVSGSTVADGILESLFKLDTVGARVCQPNSLDIYYFKSSAGAISQRALTCVAGFSGTGIASGSTRLALFKESSGGLVNGIIPPAVNSTLQFLDLLSSGSTVASFCATVSSTGSTAPAATGSFNTRDCGFVPGASSSLVTRTNLVPQAGISDLDPYFFQGPFGVTESHLNALTRKRNQLALTYNPIVSVPLFTALQRAYNYIGATGSENITSLLTIPSMRSSLLRGIFNGYSVVNASQINVNGVNLGTVLSGFDASGEIYVCRSGDSSPAMLSFNFHFLGMGCNRNSALNMQFVAPDTATCAAAGCAWNSGVYGSDFVFAGAGVSDVRSCIDYQSSQGRLAVGLASADARPGTVTNSYRYIRVDLIEPTIKAVMEGDYGFFTEFSFNDKYPNVAATPGQTLWDKVFSYASTPSVIAQLNVPSRNAAVPGGPDDGTQDTGLMVVPSSSNGSTIAALFSDARISGMEVRSTPVNSQTRQTLSLVGNNCNLPYQAYP